MLLRWWFPRFFPRFHHLLDLWPQLWPFLFRMKAFPSCKTHRELGAATKWHNYSMNNSFLVGGWPTPLKNMSRKDYISHIWWKIKFMFQITKQFPSQSLMLEIPNCDRIGVSMSRGRLENSWDDESPFMTTWRCPNRWGGSPKSPKTKTILVLKTMVTFSLHFGTLPCVWVNYNISLTWILRP